MTKQTGWTMPLEEVKLILDVIRIERCYKEVVAIVNKGKIKIASEAYC